MIDQAFLRSKSGLSAFHLHFLLPQVNSPALFAPISEIKNVFVVTNRSFLVRKKGGDGLNHRRLVEKNHEKTRYHLPSGHPQASSALLKANTQPHFMQRSYLVPLDSICGHWRQISSRLLRSLALTRLTPFFSN